MPGRGDGGGGAGGGGVGHGGVVRCSPADFTVRWLDPTTVNHIEIVQVQLTRVEERFKVE